MYKEHNERSQHMGLGTSMECFWKMWVGIHMDKDFVDDWYMGTGKKSEEVWYLGHSEATFRGYYD